jgi:hypothetical protein
MNTSRLSIVLVTVLVLTLVVTGCTQPGAVAPTTMPATGKFVALSGQETGSSCGYTILFIPIKNPKPLSQVIDDLVKSRGGEALIEVTSSSTTIFYLLGVSNCIEVRGKVVNMTR